MNGFRIDTPNLKYVGALYLPFLAEEWAAGGSSIAPAALRLAREESRVGTLPPEQAPQTGHLAFRYWMNFF